MKQVKEKKKKQEKIKYSKSSKIIVIICITVLLLFLILAILGTFIQQLQLFLWKNILIYLYGLIYLIGQCISIKIGTFVISPYFLIIIMALILSITSDGITSSKKIPKEKKFILVNRLRSILYMIMTIVYIIIVNNYIVVYNNPKLDTIYYKDKAEKEYTLDDLDKVFSYLENKVIELSKMQNRDSNGKIIYTEIEKNAIDDLKNASNHYDILKGTYPQKYYRFDNKDYEIDPSTYGLTRIDNIGINYNQEAPQLLNTITHELCHTRGIYRENEAVLCSVIVGLESENTLSNYAAYLEAYSRTSSAYSLINVEKARKSEDRILNLCIKNNYQEICNLYGKDTIVYVKESKKMELVTYNIENYNKEFLLNLFTKLEKYNMKLSINNKNVNIEKVFSDSNKDKKLIITIKNSKKNFLEIKDYLNENQSSFLAITQIYPNMYTGVDMNSEDAIEYYTSPIPNSNFIDGFNQDKMHEVFDYSRVARLIMEYLDYKYIK